MNDKKAWNEETIGRVFGIIYETLYSMALYYEIRPSERNNQVFDPFLRKFWISISNNAILMSVIQWCKVFGAEHNNDTYYSHFVDTNHFKEHLNGIPYDNISNSMRNVRNKFAAHEDPIEERVKIPNFVTARKVMEAFCETVQEEYDIPQLPSISAKYESYRLQIRDCLKDCRTDWELYDED